MQCNCVHHTGRRRVLGSLILWPSLAVALLTSKPVKAQNNDATKIIIQPVTQSPEHYMKRAKELAETSLRKKDGTGYGAVVVQNGMVVGEGRNRTVAKNDPTAHSEIDGIRDACRRLRTNSLAGCDIYCSAKPCAMCQSACYWADISTIYYITEGTNIIAAKPQYGVC